MKIYKDFEYVIMYPSIRITRYLGNETDVVIPSEIEEYSVTDIGFGTFTWCSSLTSVTIPNSITSIDSGAFSYCSSLTSVSIPDSVTSIGERSFYNCSSLTSIRLPNSITRIWEKAFEGCGLYSKPSNYKAFSLKNNKLICMNNCEFKESEWSDNIDNPELRARGYHYCTNLFEIFNHYYGELDKAIVIYECEVGDIVIKSNTSLCVTNKIKPVKKLSREDVIKILNNTN